MDNVRFKNVRKTRFTQVSNELLNDDRLTLQAKGLLSIFLSNASDWEINMKEIIKRSKNGRDAHYKVIKELITHGYFARVEIRGQGNRKFEQMEYLFSDVKDDIKEELRRIKEWGDEQDKYLFIEYGDYIDKKTNKHPFPDFQYTESAETENQYINNTNLNNTNLNNTRETLEETNKTSSKQEVETLLKDSLKDSLPPQTHQTFKTFTQSYNDMYHYIGIFLRAKKEVEGRYQKQLILEDLDEEISDILLKGFRKIKTDDTIKSINNYLFVTFRDELDILIGELDRM